jgi:aminoglycoside N3'-acetyltransferase
VSVRAAEIKRGLIELGLSGLPVCVHSSLKSFGYVEGGAESVARAFLYEGCTVVVPTFSYGSFAVNPAPHQHLPRNGWGAGATGGRRTASTSVFSPSDNDLDRKDMGAIPAAVLGRRERLRGNHPLCSFTAIGPLAGSLVLGQTPSDVFAPLRELAEQGGYVLLMGVDLTKMTLLHLGEELAGRQPFRRWASGGVGEPVGVSVGGCSDGFEKLAPLLEEFVRLTTVGTSPWRAYSAAKVLRAAADAIRENPAATHCGRGGCERCNDAVKGGPILL